MKIAYSRLQTIISEEIKASDIKPLFDKLISQLGALDKSIDFLAASVTGMDPFDIDIAQKAYGRFASPHRQTRDPGRRDNLEEDAGGLMSKTGALFEPVWKGLTTPARAKLEKYMGTVGGKASQARSALMSTKENTEMKLTTAQIREMVTEVLGELSEEKEKWAQKAAEDIEKKGTEGEFTKYCGGDVTQSCIDKAARGSSTKRKRQAAFAANINSSDDLTYPKEKKKKE